MGSKAIYLVKNYLIRKRMLSIAAELFSEGMEDNPKFILPLNEVYLEMGRTADGLRLLAGYLIN
jgi:hypothetical protein